MEKISNNRNKVIKTGDLSQEATCQEQTSY